MVTQVTAPYADVYSWENLYRAFRRAAKGKRGRAAAAAFEYKLEDNLCTLQEELAAGPAQTDTPRTGAASSGEATVDPAQWLIEPLSERELEVLDLVAQGHTNREVDVRLYISLPTVTLCPR